MKAASSPDGFEKAKKLLVLACAAIAGGLAIAGSIDRSTGGVVLLVGWLLGVASLHRLGRAPCRNDLGFLHNKSVFPEHTAQLLADE